MVLLGSIKLLIIEENVNFCKDLGENVDERVK